MTRDDTKKLLMVLQTTYPNWHIENKTEAIDIWQMMLEDYETPVIMSALKTVIEENTSGFAPSVGAIIQKAKAIMPQTKSEVLNEQEAWYLVSKALRNSSYHSQEEYDKLPKAVQEAVGSAGQLRNWAQTDMDSIENVIASNFQRTYRTIMKREQEIANLPKQAKELHDMLESKNDNNKYLEG